jgi:hypothetical protein
MIHDTAQHLTEDELHDAADGTQSGAAGRATRHLIHCARCRADVERIRELLALAASLPRSIEPPAELWPEIRTRIAGGAAGAAASAGSGAGAVRTADVVDPSGDARSPARHFRWDSVLRDRRWLAAAAVLLIAISSAVTTLVIRNDSPAVADAAVGGMEMPGDNRPAPVQRVSDDYERLDRELASMLAASRDRLQPETVEKVDRNLAIIDAAIAEIRQALAEDPGNDALVQLLKASYGQKSALVRQVSAS